MAYQDNRDQAGILVGQSAGSVEEGSNKGTEVAEIAEVVVAADYSVEQSLG